MCFPTSLNCSPKDPCVPLQDDEDSYDWDCGGRDGMDWAGVQTFFADETGDLLATLQSIDEPLKPSLSTLSNTGVFKLCLLGILAFVGCSGRLWRVPWANGYQEVFGAWLSMA
jgi:hypothetical protein